MSFWASKLAGQSPPPTPATEVNAWWASAPPPPASDPQPPTQPQPAGLTVEMPRVPQGMPAGLCPECQSGNYTPSSGNTRGRCFDCGYPVVQSTSGMRVGKNVPYGKPVRQAESPGFRPDQIVGRGL